MVEAFAEYAISHEAGHAIVGRFVKLASPTNISFYLKRDSDGNLCLGDFATSFPFPPDTEIPNLPEEVKRCLCYTLAAGFAATQFSGLSLPNEKQGLDSDRNRLGKLSPRTLESFVPSALAVIKQEQRAYRELVSQCVGKYELLKTKKVNEGTQVLLDKAELEAIFDRTMFSSTDNDADFINTMSAHEAGHAALGMSLGARVEAVYAIPGCKLPNENVSVTYKTRFGDYGRSGLVLEDKVLLEAGGAAAELILNGRWDDHCVKLDRADLEKIGILNFEYCVAKAIELLRKNETFLAAVRDTIRTRLSNLKRCKVTRGGTHIILAKGSEIEKLFRGLGSLVSSSGFELEIARAPRPLEQSEDGEHS